MNCVAKAAIQTALYDGVTDLSTIYNYVERWHVGIEEWMPTEEQIRKALITIQRHGYFGLNG